MQLSEDATADEIRREMQAVRQELRSDIEDLACHARQLTNWKHYVQRSPWISLSLAALLAFWMVPKKKQITNDHAGEPALPKSQSESRTNQVESHSANAGLGRFLLKTVTAVAMRSATGLVSQKLAALLSDSSRSYSSNPGSKPPDERMVMSQKGQNK